MTMFSLPALSHDELRAAEKEARKMRGAAFATFIGWLVARLAMTVRPAPQRKAA
jgi:hypothetical protein